MAEAIDRGDLIFRLKMILRGMLEAPNAVEGDLLAVRAISRLLEELEAGEK